MFLVFKVDQTSLIIHSAVRLATGPYALPKRVLQKMRSSASPFNFHRPLVYLGHPVAAYSFSLLFPSLANHMHL